MKSFLTGLSSTRQHGHVFEGVQECRLAVVLPLARPPPPSVPPLQNFLSPSSCKPHHPSTFTLPVPVIVSLFFSARKSTTRERWKEEAGTPMDFFRTASSPPCRCLPRHPLSRSVHDVLRARATPGEGPKKNSTPNL